MREAPVLPTQFKRLEKLVRGFSNHRRIQMLYVLNDNPDLELHRLAALCGVGMPTAVEHARRLEAAGLISKRKESRRVLHTLSPLGKRILKFVETL